MRRAALAVLVVAVLGSAAHAERKELTTAQAASGIGTGVSGALFLSAFLLRKDNGDIHYPLVYAGLGSSVITPSLGHWYAGRYLTPGMGIRAVAALVSTWAVVHYTQTVRCNTLLYMECTNLEREAIVFLGLSAIAFVGGAALDFKTLPDTVNDHNARMAITPTILPTSSGPPGAGLVLLGSF